MQGIFAVSSLWVLWPLLWILDLVMQLFAFCRMIVSLNLSVFLLSCWRCLWEKVARHVRGIMTFYLQKHANGVYWQHIPAMDASILATLCFLLINLVGAEGKKQYLQKSRLSDGVLCVTAMLVDTQSGGPISATGLTPSHSSLHSHACKSQLCTCSWNVFCHFHFCYGKSHLKGPWALARRTVAPMWTQFLVLRSSCQMKYLCQVSVRGIS